MTFITHGFRVSVLSDVRERVQDLGSMPTGFFISGYMYPFTFIFGGAMYPLTLHLGVQRKLTIFSTQGRAPCCFFVNITQSWRKLFCLTAHILYRILAAILKMADISKF